MNVQVNTYIHNTQYNRCKIKTKYNMTFSINFYSETLTYINRDRIC